MTDPGRLPEKDSEDENRVQGEHGRDKMLDSSYSSSKTGDGGWGWGRQAVSMHQPHSHSI